MAIPTIRLPTQAKMTVKFIEKKYRFCERDKMLNAMTCQSP